MPRKFKDATETERERFRSKLLKLEPPSEVLSKFDELCSIEVAEEFDEDTFEDLLLNVCRVCNWTVPWEPDGVRLTFRAKKIAPTHREHKQDCGGENTPAEEQCYRRGFLHGFALAARTVELIDAAKTLLEPLERKIWKWRSAELHCRESIIWGTVEEPVYPCRIRLTGRRSSLPLKVRYRVLERDGRRCVICGASASAGALLEIDHVTPVSKGGDDSLSNLQTLCFDCNRGKADQE